MKQFDYTITDELGIHARPAGMLAKVAKSFGETVVTISKDGNEVKASQLMKLMNMKVKKGDVITVCASGGEEEAAITELEKFFKENL